MARGRRKIDPQEKLDKVKAEIESLTTELKEKKAELKQLQSEVDEANKQKLIEAIELKGMDMDKALEIINNA